MNILERIWEYPVEYAFVIGVPLFILYIICDAFYCARKECIRREPEKYRADEFRFVCWIVFLSAIISSIIYIKGV